MTDERIEHPEVEVVEDRAETEEPQAEVVSEPAKVMRIGSMVKQLLDEVKAAPLDERSRERLAGIFDRSVAELSTALSPDLQDELRSMAPPFAEGEVPTDAELRVAQAQLVGWLEGLFHGIQATLMAQQFAARQQLEQMRQLPPGQHPGMGGPGPGPGPGEGPGGADRPGTYL
ncbi:MAG: proteasome activator [Ilumatobacteraceae bacterium]